MDWKLSPTQISRGLTFNTLGKGEAKINLQTKFPSLIQENEWGNCLWLAKRA